MKTATPAQIKAIHAIMRQKGWNDEEYRTVLSYYGVASAKQFTIHDASDFIATFGTRLPDPVPPAPAGHVYCGRGVAGTPNDHLTQAQADEVEKFERILGWSGSKTLLSIQKYLHKSASVEMLMQFEARKLIHIMAQILKFNARKNTAD